MSLNTFETYGKSLSARLRLSGAELVRAAALQRIGLPSSNSTMAILRSTGSDPAGVGSTPPMPGPPVR